MRNKELMLKVKELATDQGDAGRIEIQIAIIRQTFGVKNDEHMKEIRDYEREPILSDDQIREKLQEYIKFYEWAVRDKNNVKVYMFKADIFNFIDAVRFFNTSLADEFELAVKEHN